MNYPENIEEKLGFDEIRAILRSGCRSNWGKELAERVTFSSSYKLVDIWLNQVAEYKLLLEQGTQPVISSSDVRPFLDKLSEKHTVLGADELTGLRSVCEDVVELLDFIQPKQETKPQLFELVKEINEPSDLINEINRAFDEQGQWKRNASRKLAELLDDIDANKREAYSIIQRIYNQASDKKWTSETEISVKDGRLVIPIYAEHKRKIKGIMHDESGGGKILYIEPIEVLEASNRQRELELERDREMQRILKQLTGKARLHQSDLKLFAQRMAIFDLIRSKAELAHSMKGSLPIVVKSSNCTIKNMYHPLLLRANEQRKKETVPMNITLSDENRLVVISGPNAGGKSVTIKTLALNQYMLQCGLLPSCEPDSELGFYKQIFVDIGDNQSIENDLSSYSSHLTSMKYFIEKSTPSTLLIIDEIGSGTDPNFGGAMAEAVILELNKKRPRGAITTHFGSVKSIAEQEEGMINASMMYDAKRLQPLYQFEMGKPGSSFALEVAQNIGLPKKLIALARKRSNTKQQKTDELLAVLEQERKEYHDKLKEVSEEQAYLNSIKSEYRKLKTAVEKSRVEILDNARNKAMELISGANAQIEQTIKTIKESGADKRVTKSARESLRKRKEKLSGEPVTEEQPKPKQVQEIKVGSVVRIPNSSSKGEVVAIRKNKAVVVAGIMKSSYLLSELKPVQVKKSTGKSKVDVSFMKRQQDFSLEKDVRGMRTEEALKEIDRWIDDAIVIGANNLRLIHGKGDGILKKVIRDYYHKTSHVKRITYEDVRLGGEGVSLIELA
ncbi:MAG: Smr/MutS family protein [Bacteroidia bacterium]|nr:Smr/MutS family protein [Bacteroidia bacterium]